MQEGADATIKNKEGVSGYDLAKKWKLNLDILKKIDINRKKDNCNQVFYAAKNGDVLGLKKLAELKANFKQACDFDSITLAFSKDDERIIKILLDNGIDVNVKNNRGETALMNAKTAKKVKILLSLGADKMIKDKNGKTAYERIKNDKYVSKEIKNLLKY
jgi:ankyrin repeat protein